MRSRTRSMVITLWIRKHKGVCINHKAVLRLMNRMNIRSVARRRKIYRKMTELETYHRYENVLNRQPTQPEMGHGCDLY